MSNPDEVCVCPYNKAHSIVLSRMQFHLSKCRIQHPNGEKVKCPFNTTHIIDKRELDYHLKWCQERISLDKMVYQVGSSSPFIQVPKVELQAPVASMGEVWDEEEASAPVSVLDAVKEISQTKPTLRNKICVSESVRKAHKLNERMRFIEMNNARIDSSPKKPSNEKAIHNNSAVGPNTDNKTLDLMTEKNMASDKSSESEAEQNVTTPLSQTSTSSLSSGSEGQADSERRKIASMPRDPRNPWGQSKPVVESSFGEIVEKDKVESRIMQQVAREESKATAGTKTERAPGQAWLRRPPASLSSSDAEITSSIQQMSLGERRDRGNPWRMKNIAANFKTPDNDFPSLSDSRQSGRDKKF